MLKKLLKKLFKKTIREIESEKLEQFIVSQRINININGRIYESGSIGYFKHSQIKNGNNRSAIEFNFLVDGTIKQVEYGTFNKEVL